MSAKNEEFNIHSPKDGKAIWNGEYKNPLASSKQEYETAKEIYLSVQSSWQEFTNSHYGVSDQSPSAVFEGIKQDFVNKGMTYASTLFSAMNSPLNVLKAHSMRLELREIVSQLEKLGSRYYSSSQKEVMIAFLISLMNGLQGNNSNKEYYSSCITKYVHQLLTDKKVPLSIRMLVYARVTTLSFFHADIRKEYTDEVLDLLLEIYTNPAKIQYLDQEWKTYVRLSRMVFAWKYMFFGLRYDTSKDLRLKSYVYFARYFYKRMNK